MEYKTDCKDCLEAKRIHRRINKECNFHYNQCRTCRTDLNEENSYRSARYCKDCTKKNREKLYTTPEAIALRQSPEFKDQINRANRRTYHRPEIRQRRLEYSRNYKRTHKPSEATLEKARRRQAERIPCPECEKIMRRDSIKKHMKLKHAE